MTREKARREIDSLDFYLQNHTDDYSEESHAAMMMAIKALEQESVLDKINAEIQKLRGCSDGIIDDVEDILDKLIESEKSE